MIVTGREGHNYQLLVGASLWEETTSRTQVYYSRVSVASGFVVAAPVESLIVLDTVAWDQVAFGGPCRRLIIPHV